MMALIRKEACLRQYLGCSLPNLELCATIHHGTKAINVIVSLNLCEAGKGHCRVSRTCSSGFDVRAIESRGQQDSSFHVACLEPPRTFALQEIMAELGDLSLGNFYLNLTLKRDLQVIFKIIYLGNTPFHI